MCDTNNETEIEVDEEALGALGRRGDAAFNVVFKALAAARSALPKPEMQETKEDARVESFNPRVEAIGSTASKSPGNATMCLAQEWQRDGRGLWAMRACRYYEKHGKPHDFGSWRYNVHPPAALPRVPEPDLEDALHTGDDERVDLVSSIIVAAEELDGDDVTEIAAGIIDDCHKLDALLVETIRQERVARAGAYCTLKSEDVWHHRCPEAEMDAAGGLTIPRMERRGALDEARRVYVCPSCQIEVSIADTPGGEP